MFPRCPQSTLRSSAGSRQDRRTATKLAVGKNAMSSIDFQIRWAPRGGMAADALAEAGPGRGDLAL
eukprot:4749845-Pyramimonas_sp.AAC.1